MAESSSVDVVIPFYNPPAGWESFLIAQFQALKTKLGIEELRLILVDDGSDNKQVISEGYRHLLASGIPIITFEVSPNKGKGFALRQGVAASNAQFTLYTDVDLPYTTNSMKAVFEALLDGHDIAMGYRQKDYYASVPWFRKSLSELFRYILRKLLKFPITDTQCGLKGMNSIGRSLFLQTKINRFLVDMEFIKLTTKRKSIKVTPVVVQLRDGVQFSKMGTGVLIQEAFNFVKLLLR